MKRLFWLALGATVGVLVVRKLSAKAERFTPAGLMDQVTEQVTEVGAAIRAFGAEVRAGMDAREDELRSALGIDDNGTNGYHGLDADAAARMAREHRAQWRDEA